MKIQIKKEVKKEIKKQREKEVKKVLSPEMFPTKLPVNISLISCFALDHWNAPQWLWAVIITLLVILWARCISKWALEDYVNLFDKKKEGGQKS